MIDGNVGALWLSLRLKYLQYFTLPRTFTTIPFSIEYSVLTLVYATVLCDGCEYEEI